MTTPTPTILPPSQITKHYLSSNTTKTTNSTLKTKESPGITTETPSGK
jgi:hypothetical protein